MARYNSILETVGQTPVVKIGKLAPPGSDLWVKVEAFNPLGSVKDRLALGVIEEAERSGALRPGQTVIEATSGNTGIGLAMVCARKGYPLVVTMAENFSVERRKLMRFLGAKVVLTPASERGTGMLAKAVELAEKHGWFLARQFENEANADMHSRTTAREILEDFDGRPLDYWVSGFGTGGTLKGVARVLKKERPDTHVIVCEPDNSPILSSGEAQPSDTDGTPTASHPRFRTHVVQGWTPDFIPKLAEDTRELIDGFQPVAGDEAIRLSRELAREEGIFTGISGGATFAAALEVCKRNPGKTVLCMLPDTGERYLSTPLFDGVAEEMTEEEHAISRSTPRYRFDVATEGSAASAEEVVASTPEAESFVARAIAETKDEVLMFAFEYCEFCWAVRRMLEACKIPYRTINLDTGAFRENNWGGRIRAALRTRTGSRTVPQVFVGDRFLGGCTEMLDAYGEGELQRLLGQHGIPFDPDVAEPPAAFLPSWLHSRRQACPVGAATAGR